MKGGVYVTDTLYLKKMQGLLVTQECLNQNIIYLKYIFSGTFFFFLLIFSLQFLKITNICAAFSVVGAYVGRKCSACAEAACAVAQRRWSCTQRNRRLAQHAKLDFQTPPSCLSPKGLLQTKPAQTGENGRHGQNVLCV